MVQNQKQQSWMDPILVDNKNWREKCPEQNDLTQLLQSALDELPKVNGVVIDENYIQWINCPVCGSIENRQEFLKSGFIYTRCRKCDHVFVKNQLKNEHLVSLYSDSDADQKNIELQKNNHHIMYWRLIYNKYFEIMSYYSGDNFNLLDVGCGFGNFLEFIKNHKRGKNYNLFGIELNKHVDKRLKSLVGNNNFWNQQIEEINFNLGFGHIYLWGVLEHLSNPLSLLRKCHHILENDGLLCILIPNFHSLAIKLLGVLTPTFEPRSHIQFYTYSSFDYICKLVGFEEIAVFNELPIIDLMYNYVDYSDNFAREVALDGQGYYRVHILKKRIQPDLPGQD